jgi:uncharacterized membrane protein YedE/YeeE
MGADQLSTLTTQVLAAAFVLSAAFGALVQRTGFCTMGAVSDVVTMGDWTRLRQWALAAAVATIGFALLSGAGIVSAPQTLYASTRWLWLSALAGGFVFGFGMVLASGCISKTLVRAGAGNLKSLVVTIVAAVTAFATLKGVTAVLRAGTVDKVGTDLGVNADLASVASQAFGVSSGLAALATGLLVGGALLAWALAARESRRPLNVLAGAGVGAIVLGMWWVTGNLGHLAEHPQTLQEAWLATNSGRAEGLSFVGPNAYALDWLLFFSDANKHLTVGIVSVFGVLCGSAAVALARGEFRWEGFGGTSDVGHHLAGAALMGVGGITALGCSIGQGVTGVSTLSLTSFVAVAAMLAGAVAALRYQIWRLDRVSLPAAPAPRPRDLHPASASVPSRTAGR